MTRIATVTTFFPNAADRQRAVFVENLVRAMRRIDEVDVVSPVPYAPPWRWFPRWYRQSQIPKREWIGDIGVEHPRFVVLPNVDWPSGFTYGLGVLSALWRLRRRVPDVIVHAHCAYPDGVGVALAARLLRMPYVITAHGSDVKVYAARGALRRQMRWALARAAAVIAVSRDLQARLQRLLSDCREPVPVVHIPCAGFDPGVFFSRPRAGLRRELGLDPPSRVVVFVGELVSIKGVDCLIEAWRRLRAQGRVTAQDRLVLIGEGRCRLDLGRQAVAAGLQDAVFFLGALPQATVSCWIGAADALCLPSRSEGTPNVVVEALASGVPVVASRVGGVPELVTHQVNGLLVEPGRAGALADAIAAVLSRSWEPDEIRRSVAHLTWEAIAEQNCRCLGAAAGGHERVAVA